MFEVDFEWPVAAEYELDISKSGKRVIRPKKRALVTQHRFLDTHPSLYTEFLSLKPSDEIFLQFANKYGLLVHNIKASSRVTEEVEIWQDWIKRMKRLESFLMKCRASPGDVFRSQVGPYLLQSSGLQLSLMMKSPNTPPAMQFRCNFLASAIEIQCVLASLGGRTSFPCIECSAFFEVGSGGRRLHSKFCSRACKDRYHNRVRSPATRV